MRRGDAEDGEPQGWLRLGERDDEARVLVLHRVDPDVDGGEVGGIVVDKMVQRRLWDVVEMGCM